MRALELPMTSDIFSAFGCSPKAYMARDALEHQYISLMPQAVASHTEHELNDTFQKLSNPMMRVEALCALHQIELDNVQLDFQILGAYLDLQEQIPEWNETELKNKYSEFQNQMHNMLRTIDEDLEGSQYERVAQGAIELRYLVRFMQMITKRWDEFSL